MHFFSIFQQTCVQNRTRVAKVASYETSQETSVSGMQLVVLYAPFQSGSEYNFLVNFWIFVIFVRKLKFIREFVIVLSLDVQSLILLVTRSSEDNMVLGSTVNRLIYSTEYKKHNTETENRKRFVENFGHL